MLEETRRAVEIAEGVGCVIVVFCFIESFISVFAPSFRSVGGVVAPAPLSSVETPLWPLTVLPPTNLAKNLMVPCCANVVSRLSRRKKRYRRRIGRRRTGDCDIRDESRSSIRDQVR